MWVVKRSGLREPFDRAKVVEGVRSACKNRPVSNEQMEELAQAVEDALRAETTEPTSQQVGVAVLERLQGLDDVAYLRFASVYKGFEEAGDTLASIADRADPAHASSLSGQLARETGTGSVVPGEHIFIP